MSAVAVIIPTYNNLPELRRCLQALAQQTFTDFTAYVCVDGSTDGTKEYLAAYAPHFVRMLTHPDSKNHGRNAARNLALPYLPNHRWVAFLDSDSVPLPNWLEQFLAASPQPTEVLLGRILYYAEYQPHPWVRYMQWREKQRSQGVPTYKHFITINAFLAVESLLRLEGMDPTIWRHGLGDVELGYRLSQAGHTFRYVPSARVWSAIQQEPDAILARLYAMARHNLPYLHRKHPETKPHLFGGAWLLHPWRKQLLWPFLQPFWAKRVLTMLDRAPTWLQQRLLRYLVFYAVARGFWGLQLGLPLTNSKRPLI